MYKFAALIAVAASVFSLVCATVPLYGQCGGAGYTGETVCTLPATCVYLNYWYSQCLNSASTTTTLTTTTTTTVLGVSTNKPTNVPTTTTTPTKTTTTPSTASCYTDLPTFSPPPVRANTANTAVTGLYLHRRSDGKAVLNKNIAGIPLWWTAPGTIALLEPGTVDGKPCQVKDYLNALPDSASPSASYKPLAFSLGAPISDYWSTVRLSVTAASPWGAQSWFLACPTSVTDEYLVYLQTGTDVPAGQTCALTQLS